MNYHKPNSWNIHSLQFWIAKVQSGSHGAKIKTWAKARGIVPLLLQLLQPAHIFLACGSLLHTHGSHRSAPLRHSQHGFYRFSAQGLATHFPVGSTRFSAAVCWSRESPPAGLPCIEAVCCVWLQIQSLYFLPLWNMLKLSSLPDSTENRGLADSLALEELESHSWGTSAFRFSSRFSSSFFFLWQSWALPGHSCTSGCHLPFSRMASSTFKGTCDYMESTQIIQDNLLALR